MSAFELRPFITHHRSVCDLRSLPVIAPPRPERLLERNNPVVRITLYGDERPRTRTVVASTKKNPGKCRDD